MNYEDVADAIDDLVSVLPNTTHAEVIEALTGSVISEEDADELKELLE